MSEITAFLGSYLGAVILVTLSGILFKWLFIRSAVKSGTEAAIESLLNRLEYVDDLNQTLNKQHVDKQ